MKFSEVYLGSTDFVWSFTGALPHPIFNAFLVIFPGVDFYGAQFFSKNIKILTSFRKAKNPSKNIHLSLWNGFELIDFQDSDVQKISNFHLDV